MYLCRVYVIFFIVLYLCLIFNYFSRIVSLYLVLSGLPTIFVLLFSNILSNILLSCLATMSCNAIKLQFSIGYDLIDGRHQTSI